MTLKLKVDYKSPSREQLFLGAGWEPTRDVRGAFISGPAGELLIGNWALSPYYASQLTLAFSMTNRAAVDAMMVRASGAFGSSHVIVQKSLQARLVLSPLFADPSLCSPIRADLMCGSYWSRPLGRAGRFQNRLQRWI
jgi:hypothetical protein